MGGARREWVPIYEYQCPDCGHEFEQLQKISEEPIRECPNCHQIRVKKRVSQTSFVLKGGGWYKDHYGLKGGKSDKSDKSESASPTEGAKSSGDKTSAEKPSSAPAASDSSSGASSAASSSDSKPAPPPPPKKTPTSAA
jgi:putative FmdB family regulatory protein